MTIRFPLHLLLLAAVGCSVPLDGAPCLSDENCPLDQTCSVPSGAGEGTCVVGTRTDAGLTADAGRLDGGSVDGGTVDAGCVSSPLCSTDGETICTENQLGTCRLVNGCLELTLAACPETAPRCPAGAAACACAAGDCEEGESKCRADGTVMVCKPSPGSKCGSFAAKTDCAAQGLMCATPSGKAACVCPAPVDGVVYVDPIASADAPSPTGAESPASCRFKRLADAARTGVGAKEIRLAGATNVYPAWKPKTAYALGDRVTPPELNGHFYEATKAGTSGSSTVAWPTVVDTEVNDDGVIWKAKGVQQSVLVDKETWPVAVPARTALTSAECSTGAPCDPRGYVLEGQGALLELAAGVEVRGLSLKSSQTSTAAMLQCSQGTAAVESLVVLKHLAVVGKESEIGISVSGTCHASIAGVSVHSAQTGLSFTSSGSSVLDKVQLDKNGTGLLVQAGTVTAPTALTASNSKVTGLRCSGGTLKLDQFAATRSAGSGVVVSGGEATILGTLASNTGSGAEVTGGKLTLTPGSSCSDNGKVGISLSAGTLQLVGTVASPISLSANIGGVTVSGGALSLTHVDITKNTGVGVAISNNAVVTLDRCKVTENDLSGVVVAPSSTATLGMTDTFVSRNATADSAPAGGLVLRAPTTVSGFARNVFTANKVSQVTVQTVDTWTVNLNPGATCATGSEVSCYSSADGMKAAGGAKVTATSLTWSTTAPVSGTDYRGDVTWSPACTPAAVRTCP